MPKIDMTVQKNQELIEHFLKQFCIPEEGSEEERFKNTTVKCHLTGVTLKVNEIGFEHLKELSKGGQTNKENFVIIAKPLNALQQFKKNADPETWERLKEPIRKFLDL